MTVGVVGADRHLMADPRDSTLSAEESFVSNLLERILPPGSIRQLTAERLCLNGKSVPIRDGVIRFREDDGYNASFAHQWKRFATPQLDHVNQTSLTRSRFMRETGWTFEELKDQLILEAGCGAGRFTKLMADAGANLVSFDYSCAVDVARKNAGDDANLLFLQCDILDMPFRDGAFDRVFCHGVLQHTPDPERAFFALSRVLRPGGCMSIDAYLKDGKIRPWKSKYLWRPISTRISHEALLSLLEWFIPKWLPVDTLIKRLPILGNYLGAIVPCWNYFYTDLPPELKTQWAILDTFDALAPKFDIPVRLRDVERWFRAAGYERYEVREGGNGVVGNGIKARP